MHVREYTYTYIHVLTCVLRMHVLCACTYICMYISEYVCILVCKRFCMYTKQENKDSVPVPASVRPSVCMVPIYVKMCIYEYLNECA